MALGKTITTNTGFDATYYNVSYFYLDKTNARVGFTLKGYKDAEAFQSKSESIDEISGEYTLDVNDAGVAPYDTLNIRYTNNTEKKYSITLSDTLLEGEMIQADIQALINQVLGGCYLTAKAMAEFAGATDV